MRGIFLFSHIGIVSCIEQLLENTRLCPIKVEISFDVDKFCPEVVCPATVPCAMQTFLPGFDWSNTDSLSHELPTASCLELYDGPPLAMEGGPHRSYWQCIEDGTSALGD